MSSQPGWHADPVPPQPGQAAQLRYWDGTRWTEHVAPAQAPAAPVAQTPQAYDDTQPAPYAGTYGAAPPTYGTAQATYGQQQPYGSKPPATTPDGVPLAGWWQRVLALVVDSLVVGIIGLLVAFPWVREAFNIYGDWFDELMRSTESGSSSVDTAQLQGDLFVPLGIITLINLAVAFAYHVGFLMWKQATPGKLMLGLQVRLRERPGPMPLGTVVVRWLAQFGVSVLGLVPLVGTLTGLYSLLDILWPLWDDKKQAIHDKAAKTNVVKTR